MDDDLLAATDVENEPVAEPVAQVATPEPPPSDQLRLSLTFSGECWTEISDANGRGLFVVRYIDVPSRLLLFLCRALPGFFMPVRKYGY